MYACLLWNLYTHTNDRLCGSESWKSLNSGKEIYIVKTFDDIKCIYEPYAFFQIFQSPTADSKENNIIKHVLLRGLKPAIVVRSFQNLSNFLQLRTCRKSYCLLPASALLRTAFRFGNARESSSFIFGFSDCLTKLFSHQPGAHRWLIITHKQNGGQWDETSRIFAAFSMFLGCFKSSTLGKGKIGNFSENDVFVAYIGYKMIRNVLKLFWIFTWRIGNFSLHVCLLRYANSNFSSKFLCDWINDVKIDQMVYSIKLKNVWKSKILNLRRRLVFETKSHQ